MFCSFILCVVNQDRIALLWRDILVRFDWLGLVIYLVRLESLDRFGKIRYGQDRLD